MITKPFRQGHKVPRNVYWHDEPLFVARDADQAETVVRLLNLGSGLSRSEDLQALTERVRLAVVSQPARFYGDDYRSKEIAEIFRAELAEVAADLIRGA